MRRVIEEGRDRVSRSEHDPFPFLLLLFSPRLMCGVHLKVGFQVRLLILTSLPQPLEFALVGVAL